MSLEVRLPRVPTEPPRAHFALDLLQGLVGLKCHHLQDLREPGHVQRRALWLHQACYLGFQDPNLSLRPAFPNGFFFAFLSSF